MSASGSNSDPALEETALEPSVPLGLASLRLVEFHRRVLPNATLRMVGLRVRIPLPPAASHQRIGPHPRIAVELYRERGRNLATISFGLVNDKTVAAFERNSFHAPSKRNAAMTPVGNLPSAGGKRLHDLVSASAQDHANRDCDQSSGRIRQFLEGRGGISIVLVARSHRSGFRKQPSAALLHWQL